METKNRFWKAYSFLITILLIQDWYGCSVNQRARRDAYEKNKIEYQAQYKAGTISKKDYEDLMLGNDEFYKK